MQGRYSEGKARHTVSWKARFTRSHAPRKEQGYCTVDDFHGNLDNPPSRLSWERRTLLRSSPLMLVPNFHNLMLLRNDVDRSSAASISLNTESNKYRGKSSRSKSLDAFPLRVWC